MDIVNCPKCRKLFTKMSDPLCSDCMKEEEEIFRKVKAFIDDHRDCKLEDVVKETGVSVKKIHGYIREGRIIASKGMDPLRCELCNKPITTGRLCDSCIIDINQNIATTGRAGNKGAKMHTYQENRNKK